ncbi:murein DD-endopeptidase MepM/ murein hydrolase activator NlpD [Rhodobacter sp. JA431]|uniref:peptidoglycan DD-metalloendopeptidase family protein n=1 Tax=Rhodobacter sp. JA431 TaxID=570013 RepID=UPI000BD142F4|nr:peptidoglycan DD-metalloendopeptidase family protein [Rhodobacter sp. JA431]SOC13087.1 murein DD-endopeptidase MepM/ murein hydrolase activator NlpD [Rhodobacter sp. JA431]
MPAFPGKTMIRMTLSSIALLTVAGCVDEDFRRFGDLGFDTSNAARQATVARPQPDSRGVISYPNYQVAVARQGDTVADIANRLGLDGARLARYNALKPTTVLNRGEVVSLPFRVADAPAGSAPATTSAGTERIDITSLASGAIDRAEGTQTAAAAPSTPAPPVGAEPIRHKVARGETAYSIARYYNVSAKALAEWNGLPSDMSVREGQYLLIPVAAGKAPAPATAAITQPGQGSPTPEPPSAAQPLPEDHTPAASTPVDRSAAPNLGTSRTAASGGGKFAMPVSGAILRPYVKGKNDGVDISASAGTPVKAADAGTVAAITKDTEQVPILVLRHEGGLLTVYANIDGITVKKGDRVSRGQTIAKVRAGDTGFVHFEVRKGYDSVDPMPYLQ